MALAPIKSMALGEIEEYVDKLERENRELRQKTDNTKKLSDTDVRAIRRFWDTGNWSQFDLAGAFDVNPGTISRIVRGIYHKDIVSAA